MRPIRTFAPPPLPSSNALFPELSRPLIVKILQDGIYNLGNLLTLCLFSLIGIYLRKNA
jgi:hypothetical protein